MNLNDIIKTIEGIPHLKDKVENDILSVRDELIGIQAINPHAVHNSASRGLMQTGQFAQKAVLVNPEPPIIQEGLTYQLRNNTWKCKVPEDCIVKAIISSKDYQDINSTETIILIVEYMDGILDIIDIPLYYSISEFGFRYKRNVEVLSNLTVGARLLKDTVLAETPGVVDGTYAYGLNVDMKLATSPNNGQDGVEISTELAERMAYRTYHKFEINYNSDKILLNSYGDENHYIPLPKVGDTIRPDGIVMALRSLEDNDIPPSIYDTHIIDPVYDECFFMQKVNKPITLNNEQVMSSKVISVKVNRSPSRKDANTHGKEEIDSSIEDLKQIKRRLVATYEKHIDKRKITPRLSKEIVSAKAILGTDVKSELRYRNEAYTTRIEIVVECTHKLTLGNKISDLNGIKITV